MPLKYNVWVMGTTPRICKYKKIKDFAWKSFIFSGCSGRDRTYDQVINSHLLYR